MGGEDIVTDKRPDLGKKITEAWLTGYVLRPDPVDPDIVIIKMVVVLRRPHQPGRFLHYPPAADLRQPDGAGRAAEAVRSLEVDRRKVQTHGPTLPPGAAAAGQVPL